MIQRGTRLNVADNSGALSVLCIGILGYAKQDAATVGDKIVISVKRVNPKGQVKKGEVSEAVIVRTQKEYKEREGGISTRFEDNAVVLIRKDNTPKGTRVFGPVSRRVKAKFPKVASLAKEVF